jgi:hypothetical protein
MKKLLILSIALTSIFHVTRGEPIDDLASALDNIVSLKVKLNNAINTNDLDAVTALFKRTKKPNINEKYESQTQQWTALGQIIRLKHENASKQLDIINFLLKQDPKPNLENVFTVTNYIKEPKSTKDIDGTWSALGLAIKKGDEKLVELLLKQIPAPNLELVYKPKSDHKYSALGYAIELGNIKIIELLLKNDPKPDIEKVYISSYGITYSALGYAIENKQNADIVKILLNHNPNFAQVITLKDGTTKSAYTIADDTIKALLPPLEKK